jgi:hypothetical protein
MTHESNNDFHGATERFAYRRLYDDRIDLTFMLMLQITTRFVFLKLGLNMSRGSKLQKELKIHLIPIDLDILMVMLDIGKGLHYQ